MITFIWILVVFNGGLILGGGLVLWAVWSEVVRIEGILNSHRKNCSTGFRKSMLKYLSERKEKLES